MKQFVLSFNGECIVLAFAIMFTIQYLEYLFRDMYAHDDTLADHMMVEKFSACFCWAVFYYLTH